MGCRILKYKKVLFIIISIISFSLLLHSCKTGKNAIAEKSGAELWSEQCSRCHNMPDPTKYTDDKWETAAMHMKIRAGISDGEINLIKEFLQTANGD